ncbi:MAG: MotA/TolQ/ExbB proton channel family protein [Kiritimatiellales bacterium]|nr:MotA/TolQ/ExbB proton channel family protein [Kiritimatiellales bacterium]
MKKTIFTIAALLMAGGAFAQGETAAEAVQQVKLLELIKTGGWAMWPLGGFSFFMVVLIVQNFISLRPKTLLHTEMMPELIKMMLGKKCKTALIYCRKNPSMFANTFGAGLERCLDGEVGIDFNKVKESVEEASVEQMSKLMKPIDYLSIIGASAPMLGLLGTVSGMIKAFNTMGTTGMGKPELLAANIGEALITTATGLVIAIPAMFFFFFFKKGFQKTLATLGRNIGFLFDALQTGKEPISFMDLETLEKMDGE